MVFVNQIRTQGHGYWDALAGASQDWTSVPLQITAAKLLWDRGRILSASLEHGTHARQCQGASGAHGDARGLRDAGAGPRHEAARATTETRRTMDAARTPC